MPDKSLARKLEAFGLNVVSLPSNDIEPLDLLIKGNGYLERYGKLDSLFGQGPVHPKPQIQRNISVPEALKGNISKKLDANAGLNFLQNLLKKIGFKGASLNTSFSKVRNFDFIFENTTLDVVSPDKLDQYINDASVLKDSNTLYKELKNDDVYVITSTAKSNRIKIQAEDANQNGLDIDLPEIENVVSANGSFKKEGSGELLIEHSGESSLVYAVKAARVFYDKPGLFFQNKPPEFRIKQVYGQTVRDENYPAEWLFDYEGWIELR